MIPAAVLREWSDEAFAFACAARAAGDAEFADRMSALSDDLADEACKRKREERSQ